MTTEVQDLTPTDDATKMTELYVRAMNSGDIEAVMRLYTDEAVSVWNPDEPITGQAHRDSVVEFMAQQPVMRAQVRESYVTNDAALLVVDWSIDITGADGTPEHLTGVGLDVLRRGTDGRWRYAIDNPFGGNS
ncbi:DUF4440 domain-containing protein [Micromonospora sp. NPDC049523]|uniref:YybH family protein n=1 Tax=Micromonospora sp. NPDC049523 TaxID=3155921 RepID=UPI00343DCA62